MPLDEFTEETLPGELRLIGLGEIVKAHHFPETASSLYIRYILHTPPGILFYSLVMY